MTKFTYGDTVKVRDDAPEQLRPGCLASVYAVVEETARWEEFLKMYPRGFVYGIEFGGGAGIEINEDWLEKGPHPTKQKQSDLQ